MKHDLDIVTLKGSEINSYIIDLARLRIAIFRDYPYLYDGDLEYEKKYLNVYMQCPESVTILVLDKGVVVGASTAIPMQFASVEFQKPFLDQGTVSIYDIFYLGESVLKHEYRGRHLYRIFFDKRENAAKRYGCAYAVFAAVERPAEDPRKPKNYVPLDNIWKRFGYIRKPELQTYFSWKDIGESEESFKPMMFWEKKLNV